MEPRYLPTGNEWVSLPTLREEDGALESFSFLHMGCKGLIEQRGSSALPLIAPFFEVAGAEIPLQALTWTREGHWIPTFRGIAGPLAVEGMLLAPVGERGFLYQLTARAAADAPVPCTFGLEGCWASSWHCVNQDKEIDGKKYCYPSGWNESLIFDLRCGLPLCAFAPMMDLPCSSAVQETDDGIRYRLAHDCVLEPGQSVTVTFYWGVGFEEVAAATSAKEMLRQGWQGELDRTLAWLEARRWPIADPRLDRLYHTNLFFCLFYAAGRTLDTEELVLVTSRSTRYYVSAAYWDRDSLLWAFPAVLDADPALAREMLDYVFGRQGRNFGVHSRYIDGTVLEPGFELDELMAPVLALDRYVAATGDRDCLADGAIRAGLAGILRTLATKRHKIISLYETFLQPTDDVRSYPYLTYDNVLVWKGLNALAWLYPDTYGSLAEEAEAVRRAIWEHCVVQGETGPYFAWSTDLAGHTDVYDEPPGSLLLLPHLGFCEVDDPAWRNTVAQIRAPEYPYSFAGCSFADIGCAHAPHPWMLSVANSLLSGQAERALDLLRRAEMDNGIVCESIDEHTGRSATGEAFATCAGFVCHALRYALGGTAYEN